MTKEPDNRAIDALMEMLKDAPEEDFPEHLYPMWERAMQEDKERNEREAKRKKEQCC